MMSPPIFAQPAERNAFWKSVAAAVVAGLILGAVGIAARKAGIL